MSSPGSKAFWMTSSLLILNTSISISVEHNLKQFDPDDVAVPLKRPYAFNLLHCIMAGLLVQSLIGIDVFSDRWFCPRERHIFNIPVSFRLSKKD